MTERPVTEPETTPNPSGTDQIETGQAELPPLEVAQPEVAQPEVAPAGVDPTDVDPAEVDPAEVDPTELAQPEVAPTEDAPLPVDPLESSEIGWPDTDAETATRARLLAAGSGGALGRLGELAIWLSGVQGVSPPHEPQRPRLIVFSSGALDTADDNAADDNAAENSAADDNAAENSAADDSAAGSRVGPATVFAAVADVGLRVVTVDSIAETDPAAVIRAAIETGIRVADEEIEAGADLFAVGALGSGSDTAAAVVVSVMALVEPIKVVGPSNPLGDQAWMRQVAEIRDTRLRALPHRHEVEALLTVVGRADLAAITGFLMHAASRRTPVILDGKIVGAAALLAREISPNAVRWWQAGERGTDPANLLALDEFSAIPLLDLGLDVGDGVGAVLAVPLVRAAARGANDLPVTGE